MPTDFIQVSGLLAEGQFARVEAICREVLASEPANSMAAHLLGLALKDSGNEDEGTRWLRQSIRLEPGRAEFHINLGNLLRRRRRFRRAAESYRSALALAPLQRDAQHSLALTLLDLGLPAEALPIARSLVADFPADLDAVVLLALVLTQLGKVAGAELEYRRILAVAPDHPVALHNLGALLSRQNRPHEALQALTAAERAGAASFESAYNLGRASLEVGDLEAAQAAFVRALQLAPEDLDAQASLARLRYMQGDPQFARSLAAASAANRDNKPLQLLMAQLLWRGGELGPAEALVRDLLARKGPDAQLQAVLAGILLDQGMFRAAEDAAIEAATGAAGDPVVAETLVVALLARGKAADAQPFIRQWRVRQPLSQAWIAYEATAARILGDERHKVLFDYERLVRPYDIAVPSGWGSVREFNAALKVALDQRHPFKHQPLDQSMRFGTQTTRSLLGDEEPVIQAAIRAFAEPIADYCDRLGRDPDHPLSARNTGGTHFTGAWSVRLKRNGFHVDHIHPDGWLSSAYYVDVPPEVQDAEARSGWIRFGQARYPAPGFLAERHIQPCVGSLVLFPSYMWHGTNPIHGDDPRMTIAFDVLPGAP